MTVDIHSESRPAEERQVHQQLREAEIRLLRSYADDPEIGEDRVREAFRSSVERFTGARITSFLPILVERATRAALS